MLSPINPDHVLIFTITQVTLSHVAKITFDTSQNFTLKLDLRKILEFYDNDVKADQVRNLVDNTGENGKKIKKLYPIFDISSMFY